MWPTFKEGEHIQCSTYSGQNISEGDVIVFHHPYKPDVTCVKRVKSVSEKGLFVEGDNPDPLASEDSHNYGLISYNAMIAIHTSSQEKWTRRDLNPRPPGYEPGAPTN